MAVAPLCLPFADSSELSFVVYSCLSLPFSLLLLQDSASLLFNHWSPANHVHLPMCAENTCSWHLTPFLASYRCLNKPGVHNALNKCYKYSTLPKELQTITKAWKQFVYFIYHTLDIDTFFINEKRCNLTDTYKKLLMLWNPSI